MDLALWTVLCGRCFVGTEEMQGTIEEEKVPIDAVLGPEDEAGAEGAEGGSGSSQTKANGGEQAASLKKSCKQEEVRSCVFVASHHRPLSPPGHVC